jgi:hypothetical protein
MLGTEQYKTAVWLCPAVILTPSARSTSLAFPMIPAIPKGGLDIVMESGAAFGPPPLVILKSKLRVSDAYTVPKLKGVPGVYGSHSDSSTDLNSITAFGLVPATPKTSRSAAPPSENSFT